MLGQPGCWRCWGVSCDRRCWGAAGTHRGPVPGNSLRATAGLGAATPVQQGRGSRPVCCLRNADAPPTEATGWLPAWKIPVSWDAQNKNRLFEPRLLWGAYSGTLRLP